jgi:predicted phosphodiesterase
VRTLLISDLHIGTGSRADLLRSEALREPLLDALGDVERVVLLGDILELRHGPARDAMAAARPFIEDLGRALGEGEVVICPGNHDYALIAAWLSRRGDVERPESLGVEQRPPAAEVSPALATLAEWLLPAELTVAYPGVWVRPDVYATHGHYLDCHVTIPTLERLGIGAMFRVLNRPADSLCSVDDYEMVSGPLFAWIDAVARQGPTGPALNGSITVRAWHALGGDDSTHNALVREGTGTVVRDRLASMLPVVRRRALVHAFPLVVGALNRAGMGPLNADISGPELRRAGLSAIGEVAARLGLSEAYVIFGHTHRAGPLPRDDEQEWRGRLGARLVNTGCWTYERAFLSAAAPENPYWPGGCVVVEDSGAPQVKRLLAGCSHEQLREAMRAVAPV